MEVILIENVQNVGSKGDVIRVRDGFGRNFLLARKLAIPSNRANRAFAEEQKGRMAKRIQREKTEALEKSERLSQLKVTIAAQAGEQDKLFGSVTAEDIAEALRALGQELDRKQIHLKDPIKSLGNHPVTVEIYPQVKAAVTVEVVRKA